MLGTYCCNSLLLFLLNDLCAHVKLCLCLVDGLLDTDAVATLIKRSQSEIEQINSVLPDLLSKVRHALTYCSVRTMP